MTGERQLARNDLLLLWLLLVVIVVGSGKAPRGLVVG